MREKRERRLLKLNKLNIKIRLKEEERRLFKLKMW